MQSFRTSSASLGNALDTVRNADCWPGAMRIHWPPNIDRIARKDGAKSRRIYDCRARTNWSKSASLTSETAQ